MTKPPVKSAKVVQNEAEKHLLLLKRQQKAFKSREHLIDYAEFTMEDPTAPGDATKSAYEKAQYHSLIATALEDVVFGRAPPQLIIELPPRHGKTQLCTKDLTAWVSGHFPNWDIAVASYSDTMAEDMGADVRAILHSPQHKMTFPNYALRRGGNAKANIQTREGGRLVFVGRGGSLTGRGMNLGIGDDLFKDHEEARSQTIRDAAWKWFTSVFMTRSMGLKLVILTMTRWHSDDIIGRITDEKNQHFNKQEAENWKIIRLPALSEGWTPEDGQGGDPLRRPKGEPLWPERFDKNFLESRRRLDPLMFASLYQQRPTVADGTLFLRDNIRRYKPEQLPKNLRYYASSDHAVSTGQRNDPTCLLKVGVDEYDDIYVLECDWWKMTTDRAVEAMLELATNGRNPIFWWAEQGHITQSIGPFLRKMMHETGRYINLIEVTPAKDKMQRAQAIAARVAQRKVYFPAEVIWANAAIEEMLEFPNGTHDDFVDALSYIGIGLQSLFGASMPKAEAKPPEFGTLAWVKQYDKWAEAKKASTKHGDF